MKLMSIAGGRSFKNIMWCLIRCLSITQLTYYTLILNNFAKITGKRGLIG